MSEQLSPLDPEAIDAAVDAALADIAGAANLAELKEARLAHTGDRAPLTLANRAIGTLAPADKATAGRNLGQARARIGRALADRTARLEEEAALAILRDETVDVTTPADRLPLGSRHPLNALIDDVSDFFTSMGWEIAEGPELEHEWFNFDALNFGPDHPARQMQDTFFVDDDGAGSHLVLRTHTSPVQARTLLERDLPVYIACPGKVFRTDALDATHTPVFHQVEGLAVDKGITMAHLRGTLDHFARAMFGPEARTRLRPSFFPFTEPSAEIDIQFQSGPLAGRWLEVSGAGQVHPNVVRNMGLDPERFIGFAFGMGPDRLTMLRYGVNDLRLFFDGDIRFLSQFQ